MDHPSPDGGPTRKQPPDPPAGTAPLSVDAFKNARPNSGWAPRCMELINHEFRSLQLDRQLTPMSVFDLIDHCASLFEESSANTRSEKGLRTYIRSYLIFNYFVNTFIMIHFNGFAQFMASSPQDFIIYLNLYNFFRSDDIIGEHAFDVNLPTVRLWVIQYLTSKDLLSFDVELLYNWLDEYMDYLQHKDPAEQPPASPESPQSVSGAASTASSPDADVFEFKTRFPEVGVPAEPPLPAPPPPPPRHHTAHGTGRQSNGSLPHLGISVQGHSEAPTPNGQPAKSSQPAQNGAPAHASGAPHQKEATGGLPHSNGIPHSMNGHRTPTLPYPRDPMDIPLEHVQPPSRPVLDSQARRPQPAAYGSQERIYRAAPRNAAAARPACPAPGPSSGPSAPPAPYPHPHSHGSSHSPQRPAHGNTHARPGSTQRSGPGAPRVQAVCGLKNVGSSCYINSTVQTLFGLDTLEASLFQRPRDHQQYLAEALGGLMATFAANRGATVAPTKFLRTLSALKPDFNIPFEQQDAQEFLLFLLDRLHEELAVKPAGGTPDHVRRWGANVVDAEREEYLRWCSGLVNYEGESAVTDTFQGHVQSRLVCTKCGHNSVSYSPFTILSLPIPAGSSRGVDLSDCLNYYTQDEVLTGDNAWNCPKCSAGDGRAARENPMDVVFQPKRGMFRFGKRSKSPAKRAARGCAASIKQLSLIKLPPVMFIHLSRFAMGNVTDKLNTDITYPLRLKFSHRMHETTYHLTGVINHFGTLKSGHYTALVDKSAPGCEPYWCYFDDDHVRHNVKHGSAHGAADSKLRSRDVYVLCYERS